ncbi:hypothetical protein TNCV_527951 [Trichonephila clavipes]|nr:hypothetical protein TNCV_527951 [Trichonephila clavipes]
MDVCKCIVPLRDGSTLNSRQVASPLVRLLEGKRGGRPLKPIQGVLPSNRGTTDLNRTVICMVLKAMSNDRRISSSWPQCILRDSIWHRQTGSISNNNKKMLHRKLFTVIKLFREYELC